MYLRISSLALLGIIFWTTSSCKKSSSESSGPNTPSTEITTDLANRMWLSRSALDITTDFSYYTLTVYNPATKVWFNNEKDPWDMRPRPANGIQFSQDGKFEICKFADYGTGGLRSYSFFYMKGTAEQSGNTIKLHPVVHQGNYYSTSDPSLNYDKPLAKDAVTFTYSITALNDGWQELHIHWSDNTDSYFYNR